MHATEIHRSNTKLKKKNGKSEKAVFFVIWCLCYDLHNLFKFKDHLSTKNGVSDEADCLSFDAVILNNMN